MTSWNQDDDDVIKTFCQFVQISIHSISLTSLIVLFAVQGANADCQLASFSYFYLLIVFTAGEYNNFVHTCLREHIWEEGMFMSGSICTMVDLFDKAVAEGAR